MTILRRRFLPRFSLQNYLFKRLKRAYRIELTARRIYILPTREGFFFGIVIFLLLSGAMNYNNSLLFIYTFLLASIGIITMYHTHNNLLHVVTHAMESIAVFSGEYITIPVQISLKPGQTKARYNLTLERVEGDNHGKQSKKNRLSTKVNTFDSVQQQFLDLEPSEQSIVNFHVKTLERGYLKPPRLSISSRYPLGLLRAWSNLLFEQQYLVYPQPLNKAELNKAELNSEDGVGDKGKGHDEFVELREKKRSDSYSHVHWKAYARNGIMLVKQYGGVESEHINLNWSDFSQYETEKRLSFLTRILLEAHQQQQSFSLVLPNEIIALGSGKTHLHRCLKALALFPKSSTSSA